MIVRSGVFREFRMDEGGVKSKICEKNVLPQYIIYFEDRGGYAPSGGGGRT